MSIECGSSLGLTTSGPVHCTLCHTGKVVFDQTQTHASDGIWRITANPIAWGNPRPEVLVLGFSKGPSQAGVLKRLPLHEIPFRKGRLNVGKILAHVGLLPAAAPEELKRIVNEAITCHDGRIGWGSLIRCTVEKYDRGKNTWIGSGGMIDKFMASGFGKEVSARCTTRFLATLPIETKIIIMFGLGKSGSYIRTAGQVIRANRPGDWRTVNEVAYTDGRVTVVHVEHFASQGANIPNWLGQNVGHSRARYGLLAREAVEATLRS